MIIGHFLPLDRILNQSTTDIISDQTQDTIAMHWKRDPKRTTKHHVCLRITGFSQFSLIHSKLENSKPHNDKITFIVLIIVTKNVWAINIVIQWTGSMVAFEEALEDVSWSTQYLPPRPTTNQEPKTLQHHSS